MAVLLETNNLNITLRGREILKDVSLRLEEKDFVTIVGPSGAGKTTLLKCLLGFIPPDSGKIFRRKGIKIGYMPQKFSVEQTIPVNTRDFLNLRRKEKITSRAAGQFGISEIMDVPLGALSGGELQRVLMARALADAPDILIMDEPTYSLDISGQAAFYNLLDQVRARHNPCILMVSHDLYMVMASTKRVICLFHHICCSGQPQAVVKNPEFIRLFGEEAARIMTVYPHHHTHTHDHDHTDAVSGAGDGKRRPHG